MHGTLCLKIKNCLYDMLLS